MPYQNTRSVRTTVWKSAVGVMIAAVIIGSYNWYHESEIGLSLWSLALMYAGVLAGSLLYDYLATG